MTSLSFRIFHLHNRNLPRVFSLIVNPLLLLMSYLKYFSLAPESDICTTSPICLTIFVLLIEKVTDNAEDEWIHGRYPQKENDELSLCHTRIRLVFCLFHLLWVGKISTNSKWASVSSASQNKRQSIEEHLSVFCLWTRIPQRPGHVYYGNPRF